MRLSKKRQWRSSGKLGVWTRKTRPEKAYSSRGAVSGCGDQGDLRSADGEQSEVASERSDDAEHGSSKSDDAAGDCNLSGDK